MLLCKEKYIISTPSFPPFAQAKTTAYTQLIATYKNNLHRLWPQTAKTADVLRKKTSFVHLTSGYFSAVISVITTTIFRRALLTLLIDPYGTFSSPSPSEASEGDVPLCAKEHTQVKPFPCLHPHIALLQRTRVNTGWGSKRVYLWDEAWLNFAPKQGASRDLEQEISWGSCSLLPRDLRRMEMVSLNQMSIKDNLKRQQLSQLKADTETTIITKKDTSYLLFLFLKKVEYFDFFFHVFNTD